MRTRRRFLFALVAFVLVLAAVWAGRWRLLALAGTLLVQADSPGRAGLIFLLNGDLDTRPAAAADLWKKGYAPQIAIARSESSRAVEMGLVPNVTDLGIAMLEKLGVPRAAIVEIPFPGGATSTLDEARALRKYLESSPAAPVLVVTNAIHTRRCRRIFSRTFQGRPVKFLYIGVPDRRYQVEMWWENEHGFLGVYNEWLKVFYYWWRY
jgi:uncharacterized SAM-binding protein YcdF (DUF218 family)